MNSTCAHAPPYLASWVNTVTRTAVYCGVAWRGALGRGHLTTAGCEGALRSRRVSEVAGVSARVCRDASNAQGGAALCGWRLRRAAQAGQRRIGATAAPSLAEVSSARLANPGAAQPSGDPEGTARHDKVPEDATIRMFHLAPRPARAARVLHFKFTVASWPFERVRADAPTVTSAPAAAMGDEPEDMLERVSYDAIVLGTGLVQSVVAGCAAQVFLPPRCLFFNRCRQGGRVLLPRQGCNWTHV